MSQRTLNCALRLLSTSPIFATSFSRLLALRFQTQPRSLKLPRRYDNHARGQANTLHLWLLIFSSETFKFIKRASLSRHLPTQPYVIGYPSDRSDSRSTNRGTIVLQHSHRLRLVIFICIHQHRRRYHRLVLPMQSQRQRRRATYCSCQRLRQHHQAACWSCRRLRHCRWAHR